MELVASNIRQPPARGDILTDVVQSCNVFNGFLFDFEIVS